MNRGQVLITGSNGGIGLEITRFLLESGHRNLICHYQSSDDHIKSLLKEYDLDSEKICFKANLVNEEEVIEMKNKIETQFGNISCLLNIAGSSSNGMSWKVSVDQFKKTINDNLLTSFICAKTFIPTMRENNWGRIINFSSVVGFTGVAGASSYCAAKAGLVGLTKSLSLELANKNITVNTIALGYFQYGLINDVSPELQTSIISKIPMQRLGSKDDIGHTVQYLLDEKASFVTGQVVHLNGGLY